MKKALIFILCTLTLLSLPLSVMAHPGRTDSNGGHYDRSTGEYHYHHGYSAHQHKNGVCPYESTSSKDSEDPQNSCKDTFNLTISFLLAWFVVSIGMAKLNIGYKIISQFNPDVHRNANGPFIVDIIISFIATLLIFGFLSLL